VEVVASLSQGRTAAEQCGLFTYKSVLVILEPPCTFRFHMKVKIVYFLENIHSISVRKFCNNLAALFLNLT